MWKPFPDMLAFHFFKKWTEFKYAVQHQQNELVQANPPPDFSALVEKPLLLQNVL